MLDIPTAWAIQREMGAEHHHPRCSSVTHRMLCDCGAIQREWLRRRELYAVTT